MSSPRRRTTSGFTPRIWASSLRLGRLALGQLDTVGSRTTAPTGRSSRSAVRSRQAPSSRATARSRGVEAGGPRQPPPHLLRDRARRSPCAIAAALLARPLEPAARLQPRADVVGERQQVLDVAARVAQLLVGQRPRVPAREAGGLRQPDLQDVVQQAVVARLRGEAGEARRHLRVEHVARRRSATRAAGSRRPGGRRGRRSRSPGSASTAASGAGVEARRAGRAPTRPRRRRPGRGRAAAGTAPRA